ncbi:MAG: hypothetical protein AB4063_17180 [Crocosphaera sp.]
MFKEKIEQLSESDISYISGQIEKLKKHHNNSLATQDTLYRIATNAELFSPQQLSISRALSPEQTRITMDFIRYFNSRNQKSLLGYICQLFKIFSGYK